MPNVALIGGGLSWIRAPWENKKWETFAHASIHVGIRPREADLWFDIHRPDVRSEPKEWARDYSSWLMEGKDRTSPIVVQDIDPRPINSIPLPREGIKAWLKSKGATQREYVTSSASWMLLYTLYREASKAHPCKCSAPHPYGMICPTSEQALLRNLVIGLWGINFEEDTEYVVQRPCIEYWLGFTRALGVKVFITPTSRLCRDSHVYGFDGHRDDLLKGHTGQTFGATRITTAHIQNGLLRQGVPKSVQALIDEELDIFGIDSEALWKEAASKF